MNAANNYADIIYSGIDNDIDTLEKNVKEFPGSSLARFLLLYHYKKNNNPGFEKLAGQTGVYINNPLWIQYQLSISGTDHLPKENNETTFELEKQNQQSQENISLAVEEHIMPIPVLENEVVHEESKEDFSFGENQNETSQEYIPTSIEQETSEVPLSESEVVIKEQEEDLSDKENQIETTEENISPIVEQEINEIPVSENQVADEERNEDWQHQENISTPVEQEINEIPVSENQIADEERNEDWQHQENISTPVERQINEIPVSENQVADEERNEGWQHQENISTPVEQQINEIPVSENQIADEERNEGWQHQENISSPVEQQINEIPVSENQIADEERNEDNLNETEEEEEELIAFEPLHTVDYFASQGIKISEEALENDHLGQQVKSFTAWLKSMKKLHPGQLPEQNEVIEKIIQANAEISNQNANVLTEAMAEVLIKQDKKEKAIEMYQKLSLMNPSKSAYFAAKIESLKTI